MLVDIKPILYGATVFGCSPFLISEYKFIKTQKLMVYSIIIGIISGFCFSYTVYLGFLENELEIKAKFLVIVRLILFTISFFVDCIITVYWNHRLTLAFNHLRVYDLSANYHNKCHKKIKNICQIIMTITIIFWTIGGLFSYVCVINSRGFNVVFNFIYNTAMSTQIFKFCGIMWLLYQRFNHLSRLLVPDNKMGLLKPGISVISGTWKHVKLQDVWCMHCSLSAAAAEINSTYSAQLFVWIVTISLNLLSRVYTLIITMSNEDSTFRKIREIMWTIACLINLFLIVGSCHITSRQANNVAEEVFSVSSVIRRKSNIIDDNMDAIMYFYVKRLHFSAAAGFIHVRLPLLISIAGAITTYLVILHKPGEK